MAKIIVAGSACVDYTAKVKSLPKPGETVGGARFYMANGGKGANQAVSASKLGGDVLFIASLGNDDNGRRMTDQYGKNGIDTSRVKFVDGTPTAVALIFVDENAENSIAVAPEANDCLMPSDIESAECEFRNAEYLLMQLEIPMETIEKAAEIACRNNVRIVLNPAPMATLTKSLLEKIYLLTPNETEAEKLTGVKVQTREDAEKATAVIKSMGVQNVIITMGSHGSYVDFEGLKTMISARKVNAVDTTGAGDVYNGALVTALADGKSPYDACWFATVAASISVTQSGAQTSVPQLCEVLSCL